MSPTSSLRLAFLLLCLAAVGCTTRPPELKPKGTASITLNEETKSTNATVQLLNFVTITLPAPKAEGYLWQISFLDVRYLKQTTEILPGAKSDAGPTVSFIARNPGRTRVRFLLLPPMTNRGVAPVDQQEVVFTIQ
jgi:hypothetical protein